MKKILILTNSFSGLLSFRKELVYSLSTRGLKIIISGPIDNDISFFKNIGCQIVETNFNRKGTNPFKDITLLLFYIRLFIRVKPQMVLSYTIKPNIYGGIACRFCRIPQIANITGLGTALENPGIMQILTKFLLKIGLRRTDVVFFQNKANQDFCLRHGIVNGSHMLIPGSGVNLQHHSVQEYPKEFPIRFIFVSRLIKQKGIEEYLAAAQELKAKYSDSVEFHVIGYCEGPYLEILKDLEDKGIVDYHGVVSDIRPYLGKSQCTIHPSFYPEGMSNVLLESCATGRPIITTNRPGCGEIVDDGINGYVVKAQNVGDLVKKIEKFISLPYEKKKEMGAAGREKMEKKFDRNIVIEAYVNEINRVLENNS